MPTNQKLLESLAEILERPTLSPDTILESCDKWDSVAVVMTVAALDDLCGVRVSGERLTECITVADILAIAEPQ
jgi:acyl carrier protein